MIGQFTNKAKIQASVRSSDGSGGYTELWTDIADVWCSIEEIQTPFLLESLQNVSTARYRVKMHYLRSYQLTTNNRLYIGGRQLQIEAVKFQPRKMMQELTCALLQVNGAFSDPGNNVFPYTFPFELS